MSIVSVCSSRPSCLRHGSKINLSDHDQKLPFASTNIDLRKRSSCHLTIISQYRHRMAIYSGEGLGFPSLPDLPRQVPWPLWMLGMLISAILPFGGNKLWPFLILNQNVDKVVDAVEEVAEMVETAAEGVEKVAEEVAEHLPQGGQLQKAALFLENAAKTLSKDAHVAEQIVHKIEEVEDKVISSFKKNGETKEEEDAQQKKDQK
ncbi:uncharacterized protein LOC111005138 [Momordica charantia]|uniref:Uncharacterized protein LOC111005138 n=1 Tax=Momordica charantia TaxID=3673 RepID=A0A6J1BVN6_MOMCH|nr:uncharacterized protein LOC111005138 [Momordica charantia]